jgi:hypothetical protein
MLGTANAVPSSPILVTLMVEALRSPKMSVLTRATRRNNPDDGILDSPFSLGSDEEWASKRQGKRYSSLDLC